ncbi:hypothetical protein RB653_003717 [Dictyostelium firmibasis]|uniref:alpha-1,2-Mannosidase n=1 Tax=Dictyostelium firmibasis TaxID=79012 RepID=A0AAN7TYD4_9MYCE
MIAAIFIIGFITILSFDGGLNRGGDNPLPQKWRNIGIQPKERETIKTETTTTTTVNLQHNTGNQMPNTNNIEKQGGGEGTTYDKNRRKLPRVKAGQENPFNKIDKVYKQNEKLNKERSLKVREEMKYCWEKYREIAWGLDELKPIEKRGHDWFGLGLTIVDSMDTLYLMGLDKEFEEAREWVAEVLNHRKDTGKKVSVFETTIRFLGTYITMYSFTGDKMYLDKGKELADLLLYAFKDGSPFPASFVSLTDHRTSFQQWAGECVILCEPGSMFLELNELSRITGDPKYKQYSDKIVDTLAAMRPSVPGLYPTLVSQDGSRFCNNQVSIGAMGDSFYEYLLKMWVYQDGVEERYSELFQRSADAIIKHLYKVSKQGDGFITNLEGGSITNTQEHLTCFAGGMFMLAAASNITGNDEKSALYMEVGEMVTKTCAKIYTITPTGLGPEVAYIDPESGDIRFNGYKAVSWYILRPETVESIFIAYRLTGKVEYQELAWQIFEALVNVCKTENGYVGLNDVSNNWAYNDNQQSFFMAETLKYLYLIFQPSSVIPLDKYVFNTEAHPFEIQYKN